MASPAPNQPQGDPARHIAVLDELVAMGADLARQVHAAAGTPDLPLNAATVAFDRVARTVRRTVNLLRLLAQPPRAPATAGPDPAARLRARKRILRTVEDAISRAPRTADPDRLTAELRDRLDAPDLDEDLVARPLEDIVEEIIRDLGLAAVPGFPNPWKRRSPAEAAALHRQAAAPPRIRNTS